MEPPPDEEEGGREEVAVATTPSSSPAGPFACPQCSATYQQKKRLNEHIRQSHSDVSQRTCPHCGRIMTAIRSLSRHVDRCPKRPAHAVVCNMPPTTVPPRPSDPRSKAKIGKRGFEPVEQYVPLLKAYLCAGNFIYSFPTKRSSLAETTITSYCSFVRKYLEAVFRGLSPRSQGGTRTCLLFPPSLLYYYYYY